jgi:ketosteroid isomerase-like protein
VSRYRKLAEASVDAWNREDLQAWLDYYDPAAEFHTSGAFPGLKPVYRGHGELASFWRAMHEPWETLRLELERFAEGDDWTVVEFRFRATGVESGASVDMLFCNASLIVNGRAAQVFARREFEEAVEALQREGSRAASGADP